MNGQKTSTNPILGLLNPADKDSFVDATRNLPGPELDILIESPGGLAEAVESIVAILRAKYDHIRFLVPGMAKSAATMLALSGDQIVGGVTSELGPIDPQMPTGRGGYAPAQAILDQFEEASRALKADPQAMSAWLPILQQYGPALLQECRNRQLLSEQLVSTWLETYMGREEDRTRNVLRGYRRRLPRRPGPEMYRPFGAWLASRRPDRGRRQLHPSGSDVTL
jgi:hypothetical protein